MKSVALSKKDIVFILVILLLGATVVSQVLPRNDKHEPLNQEDQQIAQQEIFIENTGELLLISAADYKTIDTSKSSFVENVFYSHNENMLVLKLNDNWYSYCGVPSNVWSEFTLSSSFGSFYNNEVKGSYSCLENLKSPNVPALVTTPKIIPEKIQEQPVISYSSKSEIKSYYDLLADTQMHCYAFMVLESMIAADSIPYEEINSAFPDGDIFYYISNCSAAKQILLGATIPTTNSSVLNDKLQKAKSLLIEMSNFAIAAGNGQDTSQIDSYVQRIDVTMLEIGDLISSL